MKKLITTAFLLLSGIFAYSQNPVLLIVKDPSVLTDKQEMETQTTAVGVSKAILEGNWAKLDSLLDDNFTYTGDGYQFTKDQYIGFMQEMRSAFSNFEMILEKNVVDKQFVSIRFTSNVINTGKFMGAPANKKNLVVTGIFMRKVQNGKVMQEWQTTDLLGTMKQIGGGSLFFYSLFVGGFNIQNPPPARMPNDFLYVNGKVENFDRLSAKQKNKYLKKYKKELKKKKA